MAWVVDTSLLIENRRPVVGARAAARVLGLSRCEAGVPSIHLGRIIQVSRVTTATDSLFLVSFPKAPSSSTVPLQTAGIPRAPRRATGGAKEARHPGCP